MKHFECPLMAYFLSRNSSILLSNIGLSNLPCEACFLWLEAVGEESDRNLFTKWPHNKWYLDCPRPAASVYNMLLSKNSALFLEKGEFELSGDLEASCSARPRAQPHNQIPVKLISNPTRTPVCAANHLYFFCTWGNLSAASLFARDGGAFAALPSIR